MTSGYSRSAWVSDGIRFPLKYSNAVPQQTRWIPQSESPKIYLDFAIKLSLELSEAS